jgi:hypothetical protein
MTRHASETFLPIPSDHSAEYIRPSPRSDSHHSASITRSPVKPMLHRDEASSIVSCPEYVAGGFMREGSKYGVEDGGVVTRLLLELGSGKTISTGCMDEIEYMSRSDVYILGFE